MYIQDILKDKENFTEIEGSIADYFLKQQENLKNQSARFIASQVYTAPSTVVRLCQKIGYEGYNQFKESYLEELFYLSRYFDEINPNYPFSYNDKNITVAHKMGQLYHEIIDDTLAVIHHDELQLIINNLKKSKKIYISSSGIQADLAITFKDKLLKIGKNVIIESRMDESYYIASFCDEDSTFILISYSGETEALLRVAKKLKERKITTLAITSRGGNSLAKLTDFTLLVSSREKLIKNLGNFSMNISTLLLLDILYMNIFNDDYYTNFENKVKVSKEFEKYRHSYNPQLKDK